MDDLDSLAADEADDVLRYFKNIELLGKFAGESVEDQKRTYLRMTLANFARRMMETPRDRFIVIQGVED